MDKMICKYCKEEINKDAKKCPHCHGWQFKWGLDLQNPKSVVVFFLILCFVFIPSFVFLMINLENYMEQSITKPEIPETSYEILKISESSVKTYTCGETKCVAIFGVIENESTYSWGRIHFHVELFNDNEQMIDVFSENDYDLIAPANSSTTFKVSKVAVRDLSEYAGHKINIRLASKINK